MAADDRELDLAAALGAEREASTQVLSLYIPNKNRQLAEASGSAALLRPPDQDGPVDSGSSGDPDADRRGVHDDASPRWGMGECGRAGPTRADRDCLHLH